MQPNILHTYRYIYARCNCRPLKCRMQVFPYKRSIRAQQNMNTAAFLTTKGVNDVASNQRRVGGTLE